MEDKKNNKLVKTRKTKVEENGDSLKQDSTQLPVVINKKVRVITKKAKISPKKAVPSQVEIKPKVEKKEVSSNVLKILPVKNSVLFPHNVLPFAAGKEWTTETVDRAVRIGGNMGILAQIYPEDENPPHDELYQYGTEVKVLKIVKFPDGSHGAVLQGARRFKVLKYVNTTLGQLSAEVEFLPDELSLLDTSLDLDTQALGKAMKQLVQKAIHLSPNMPKEVSMFVDNMQEATYLAYLIIPYLSLDFPAKQKLLEIEDMCARLGHIHSLLVKEIEILEMTKKLNSDVKTELSKQQRKYFIKEQIRLLQKELGDIDGRAVSETSDPNDFHSRIFESKMSAETKEMAIKEAERMAMMMPGSPEYMICHNYLMWLLDIPWQKVDEKRIDLHEAKDILNKDHFGLDKVKKRILEFLAVCALKNSIKGPILLFVGPPGVGKTSLGKSIARALGRKFIRIALGGVRDEAEIRGHRRTYIGSMPGKIADSLKKAGTMNPVILFDEVDKIASDGRGDPSSALLEVLDPEQNNIFTDHYLNVPLDLSQVFFIATANSLHSIPAPLRDRMEVVELSSYTLEEKKHIAFEYLLPHVMEDHGIASHIDVKIDHETMKGIIQHYTREAGVRQLKRELAGVVRGIARECVESGYCNQQPQPNASEELASPVVKESKEVTLQTVRKMIGAFPFSDKKRPETLPIGVATGLAWTPNGGDVLYIETAASSPGTEKLAITGQLGDVMKESVQTAYAYIRAHAAELGIDILELTKKDLHVHFPEGAVKKDGPSAGIATFLGIISQFTETALAANLAMTGEISLRGDVLPVGGIKEKLLAAHRYGIQKVLIPQDNEHDLEEIPVEILKDMKVELVSHLGQVLKFALEEKKDIAEHLLTSRKSAITKQRETVLHSRSETL